MRNLTKRHLLLRLKVKANCIKLHILDKIHVMKSFNYLLGMIFEGSSVLYLINMANNEELSIEIPHAFINPGTID